MIMKVCWSTFGVLADSKYGRGATANDTGSIGTDKGNEYKIEKTIAGYDEVSSWRDELSHRALMPKEVLIG